MPLPTLSMHTLSRSILKVTVDNEKSMANSMSIFYSDRYKKQTIIMLSLIDQDI